MKDETVRKGSYLNDPDYQDIYERSELAKEAGAGSRLGASASAGGVKDPIIKMGAIRRLGGPKRTPGDFVGREGECAALIASLHRRGMRSLCLVGEAGCGKTELVEEAARRMGDKADVYYVSTHALEENTRYRGEFEESVLGLFRAAEKEARRRKRPIVLFLDEAHTMIGVGTCEGSDSLSLANVCKPWLSSDAVVIWGATTPGEWEASFGGDPALNRRMPRVDVGELPEPEAKRALLSFCEGWAEAGRPMWGERAGRGIDQAGGPTSFAKRAWEASGEVAVGAGGGRLARAIAIADDLMAREECGHEA